MSNLEKQKTKSSKETVNYDVVVIGAGFSGLYQLYFLREKLGLNVLVLEAAEGVGGTWYWNRYPGARCDSESHTYCYYFSDEILNEWTWSERYPSQPEILEYLNYCAERLDLKRDICFNQRVSSAHWVESLGKWRVQTKTGLEVLSKYMITAVGCLSTANLPQINGLGTFSGKIYHTGQWPQKSVNFEKKSVILVGTGSTGIQAAPVIAKAAKKLTVLQRTANFSVPARNAPLSDDFKKRFRNEIEFWRKEMLKSRHGHPWTAPPRKLVETDEDERASILNMAWRVGGLRFRESFEDILLDAHSNEIMSEFIRKKISELVRDPETAELLTPRDHPFGTKRPPIDTNYFETYNRENVELVDIRSNPIRKILSNGVELDDNRFIGANVIVFATGFDAMSGSILKLGIQGREKTKLADVWKEGPKTFLGLGVHGFPNMFVITGPGSPSVLTNMPRAIEQNVEWVGDCIKYIEDRGANTIEADKASCERWTKHVTAVAAETLLLNANHSWYLGANIPGKPRVFMPYSAGLNKYRAKCDNVAANAYNGFLIN